MFFQFDIFRVFHKKRNRTILKNMDESLVPPKNVITLASNPLLLFQNVTLLNQSMSEWVAFYLLLKCIYATLKHYASVSEGTIAEAKCFRVAYIRYY